jgi:hypothetical protein
LRSASVGVALSAMSFDLFQLHPIAAGLAHMLPGSGLSDKSRRVTPSLRSISQAPTYVSATMRFAIGAPCRCKSRENVDGPIVEKDRYNQRWPERNRTRESSFVNSQALVVDGGLLGGRPWSASHKQIASGSGRRRLRRRACPGRASGASRVASRFGLPHVI